MTYRLVIRIEAVQDITDAAIWYHSQRPGLGEEFIAAVQVALAERRRHGFIRANSCTFVDSFFKFLLKHLNQYMQHSGPTASSS